MPSANKIAHCKLCGGLPFASLSEVRKHQWAEHRDIFKDKNGSYKIGKITRKRSKDLVKMKKELEAIPVVRTEPGTGEMTVSQLMVKLKHQRDFMIDVVVLIEGLSRTK